MDIDSIGQVHDENTLFLRESVGDASDQDGNSYELATSVSGQMIVTSKKTGKKFTLDWQEFLNLAVMRGINDA